MNLGDLSVDGKDIEFIDKSDSVKILNNEILNMYLVSKSFNLNDNSKFIYGVQYGFTDSSAATELLSDGKFINFKVQLVDAATNQLIGEYDNVTYNKSNLYQYRNLGYQVDVKGIGDRAVVLRLVCSSNVATKFALNNKFATESVVGLGKHGTHRQQIGYKGTLAVTSYAIEQNYPNPFNPTTTINYQIPKDGPISIKVFDALGREIKTLVNEYKSTGRYSVDFDASKLASGMYIYRLQAGNYVATKKMILQK